MRYTPYAIALLAGLAACGGGSAAPMPDGPVKVGVIAGNNQSVTAAPSVALPVPAVVQAVQLPSGQVALRMQLLDAVLPSKAYAQTAVTGIPNMVVCARTPDPKHALNAEVLCANTDALGKAYFTFHADTVAGTSKAQVAASLSTGTKITDSVQATVKPSAPVEIDLVFADAQAGPMRQPVIVPAGGTLDLHKVIRLVIDKYGNFVAPSVRTATTDLQGLPDTTTAFTPAYAVSATTTPTAPDSTAWMISSSKLAGAGGVTVYLFAGSAIVNSFTVKVQ